ncbi:class I SAM-dependent methyltransferase [Paenibacillus sp.]|uniref:class I SAM-dependent methyltransferase n=1 Tax=Paenibacillus sp. TaxID=58172 RepID=UPI002D24820D|nr:class I SAM-dependent methyltransferase [Paenibacillus sp.]HZG86746.1 class I SAM-dependent methyltransferase [Paenibacillus sp.]
MRDSKERFGERVEHYVKYRPGYPAEALDFLYGELGFADAELIADVGAGTGIFAKLLLERGSAVAAVEPNAEMRRAAEAALSGWDRFRAVDGSAERTTLPDGSVDGIVCAQSFHWFDIPAAKREFARILRPNRYVALIWNRRKPDADPFAQEYESLLQRYSRDYEIVKHDKVEDGQLESFFRDAKYGKRSFPNRQTFDAEGLRGRAMSSSYCPLPGEPNFEPLMNGLDAAFERWQRDGAVRFEYETNVYYGFV